MDSHEGRISRLNQKLRKIEISDRSGRLTKLSSIQSRVSSIEARFAQMQSQQDADMKAMKQQTSKLIVDVDESNDHWHANLNVEKLIDAVSMMIQKVEMIAENNRLTDQRHARLLDDRCRCAKSDLAKEKKLRVESLDDLCVIIKESFPRLEEQIAEEAQRRSESDEVAHKKLSQEVNDMELELSKERATKEENEKAIFDIIKDTVEKIKRELDTERRERESSEQSLMKLLEDSMNKLNNIVHS